MALDRKGSLLDKDNTYSIKSVPVCFVNVMYLESLCFNCTRQGSLKLLALMKLSQHSLIKSKIKIKPRSSKHSLPSPLRRAARSSPHHRRIQRLRLWFLLPPIKRICTPCVRSKLSLPSNLI